MKTPNSLSIDELFDKAQYESAIGQLIDESKAQGAQAEVSATVSQGLTVTSRLKELENIEFSRGKSIQLTVYINQQKGSASTSDLSAPALQQTVDMAVAMAKMAQKDNHAGLAAPELLAQEVPDCDLYHPWALTMDEASELVRQCEATALATDKRLTNSDGANLSTSQNYRYYANSHGFFKGYASTQHSINCILIAKDEHGMQRDYEYTMARDAADLWGIEQVAKQASTNTVSRLGSRKIKTQKVPILFDERVARTLWSHLLGAISGGNLYRQSSFLLDRLGEKILPEFVSIQESPHLLKGPSSAPFDLDGLPTTDKAIIEKGQLKTYLLNVYAARKLGMAPTGHAGGVHNVLISPGTESTASLIKSLDKGFYVTELMGQGVNLVTGDYSRGAAGFWVENGEIQFPVHEVTIAGNLAQMYQQIIALSDECDVRGGIQTPKILIENMMVAGE